MYNVIFNSGIVGFLIWVLLFGASTAALAIGIRCVWNLQKSLFESKTLVAELLPLLRQGRWQEAFECCEKHPSLAAETIKAVLLVAHEQGKNGRQEIIGEQLDRRVRAVLRLLNSLSMCGNIAPMLGLLGTVTGMVDAFMGLGTAMGPEKASVLAISISQALYTTAAGLLVAVPAITFSVIFRNQLEKRTESVTDLLNQVLKLLPEPQPRTSGVSTETRKLPEV